jgi:ABC-type transport system involved in multi-copper enzyme maturation permease subunit
VTNLVRSEFRKIFTVNTWWIVGILFLLGVGVTLTFNIFLATAIPELAEGQLPAEAQQRLATNVYTSGQVLGTILVMMLGALMMTNEYHHQTATPTFLATPKRQNVIASKLITALLLGAGYALVATIVSVVVGALWLASNGYDTHLGDPGVLGTLALNLLAYGIWAIFGVGLGTLIKNQIAAVVMVFVLTIVIESIAQGVLTALSSLLHKPWIEHVVYALPSGASSVMTGSADIGSLLAETDSAAPAWYVGALVLLAWGVVASTIGTLITKSRDIT